MLLLALLADAGRPSVYQLVLLVLVLVGVSVAPTDWNKTHSRVLSSTVRVLSCTICILDNI